MEKTNHSTIIFSKLKGLVYSKSRKIPKPFLIGSVMIGFLLFVAIFAEVIAPHPYDEFHFNARMQAPSTDFLFGTDEFGRDVLSRVIVGTRLSLLMGITAAVLSLLIGVPIGLYSGYFGGWIDDLIMRIMDVIISFPSLVIGLLIMAVTSPGASKTVLVVGFIFSPQVVRLVRGVTLSLARKEFIEAARARGEPTFYLLFREVLPNIWAPITVEGSLRVTYAILLAGALSFLGLGTQPPQSDWGLMIADGRMYIGPAPWISISPGIMMCLAVIAFNLFGDGLRDLLDIKMIKLKELQS